MNDSETNAMLKVDGFNVRCCSKSFGETRYAAPPSSTFNQSLHGFHHTQPIQFIFVSDLSDPRASQKPYEGHPAKEAAHGQPLFEYYFLKPNMFRFFFFSFSNLLLSELGLGE